jgi:hypothetical protein
MIVRKLSPFLLFLVAFLGARMAGATLNFPGAVQRDLNLSYSPQCSLCHSGGQTGNGTVGTPFGKSMKARGMVASDENALKAALDQMTQEKVDSDGDGVSDIDELEQGTDPNVRGAGQDPPSYGCSLAPSGEVSPLFALAALALVLCRRRCQKGG